MMTEEERPVEGFPNYTVTDTGKIYSYALKEKREIAQFSNNAGYLLCHLQNKGKGGLFLVHRIVAQAFLLNPDDLPEVNHKDEDKTNNRADNLEYCTRIYNVNYGDRVARAAKHKARAVIRIEDGKRYPSIKAAALANHVFPSAIGAVCRGKGQTSGNYHWRYVERRKKKAA